MANLNTKVRAERPRVNRSVATCHHCWAEGHTRAACRLRALPAAKARELTEDGRSILEGRKRVMAGRIGRLLDEYTPETRAEIMQRALECAEGYARTNAVGRQIIAEERASAAAKRKAAPAASAQGSDLRALLIEINASLTDVEFARVGAEASGKRTAPDEAWMRAKVKA